MMIAGVQASTLLDFPSRLSCILFTQGCPYDCFYCHNRALIPLHTRGEGIDAFPFLRRRQGLLDGVVISGGEPTIHTDLPQFVSAIKELGYAVKLDTNGSNPTMVERLIEHRLLDYIALDVKAPKEAYKAVCGANARWEAVDATLSLLKGSSLPFEVRTTVYPTMSSDDLLALSAMIGEVPLWRLNAYRIPDLFKKEDGQRIREAAMDAAAIRAWITKSRTVIAATRVTT